MTVDLRKFHDFFNDFLQNHRKKIFIKNSRTPIRKKIKYSHLQLKCKSNTGKLSFRLKETQKNKRITNNELRSCSLKRKTKQDYSEIKSFSLKKPCEIYSTPSCDQKVVLKLPLGERTKLYVGIHGLVQFFKPYHGFSKNFYATAFKVKQNSHFSFQRRYFFLKKQMLKYLCLIKQHELKVQEISSKNLSGLWSQNLTTYIGIFRFIQKDQGFFKGYLDNYDACLIEGKHNIKASNVSFKQMFLKKSAHGFGTMAVVIGKVFDYGLKMSLKFACNKKNSLQSLTGITTILKRPTGNFSGYWSNDRDYRGGFYFMHYPCGQIRGFLLRRQNSIIKGFVKSFEIRFLQKNNNSSK